jgi:pectate lyase
MPHTTCLPRPRKSSAFANWARALAVSLTVLTASSLFAQTGTALTRHAPTLAGNVDGSVQVMTGENLTLNTTATLTRDLLVPGTPTVQLKANAHSGGTVSGTGDVVPTGYTLTIESNANVGHIVQRTAPIALPAVAEPHASTGTRDVSLGNRTPQPGDFNTLRDLALGNNAGAIVVPPGAYGAFSAGSNSRFVLGIAGASTPAVYDLQKLDLTNNAALEVAGPVVLTVKAGVAVGFNSTLGNLAHPDWLDLRITSGDLTVGSNATAAAYVKAPAGSVAIASNARLVGGSISDRLAVASNGQLQLGNVAPQVAVTAPVAASVFTAPAEQISLAADASDADGIVTRVDFYRGATLLGSTSVAPYRFEWLNVPAGTYSLTAVAIDNAGAATTSAAVTIIVNAPPSVALTSPADGAIVTAPGEFALRASAADTDGSIASVEFYRGATLLGTSTAAPYEFNVTGLAPGAYSFTAVATDNFGARTISADITVTVNAPPAVAFTAPADGATFAGPAAFTLQASASDADGTVDRVEFFQGSVSLGVSTTEPYQVALSGVAVGDYIYTAVATDNNGASTTSAPLAISVHPNQPPSVALAAPANNSTFTSPASIALSAAASDADGTIAQVTFYRGTVPLGTALNAPYQFNWTGVATGNYTVTAVATDNLGATTTSAPITITVSDPAPATIAFDGVSSATNTAAGATLTWSHVLGAPAGRDRAVVVGVVSRGSTIANASVSSVKFNGVTMVPLPGSIANAGTSTVNRSQLFYLLDTALPASAGTYTVLVTMPTSQSTSNLPVGNAISLTNVSQVAPGALANSNESANTITTTATGLAAGTWVVDTVGIGSTSASLVKNVADMAVRFTLQSSSASGGATQVAPASGSVTMSWKSAGARQVHSLAIFAPALSVQTAPSITTQPIAQSVNVGANVTLSVVATGTAPLAYQWYKDGAFVAGATAATLTLNNAQTTQSGSYTVIVSNNVGSTTSDAAAVAVTVAPPAIAAQPQSQSVNLGDSVTLAIQATGTAPLSYQWFKNDALVSGATTASLAFASAQASDVGTYTVTVTNSAGSITSAPATLSVFTGPVGPTITTQPVAQSVGVGSTVTFTVAATGTAPLSYQWRKDGATLAGATSASLTLLDVQFGDAGGYSVVVNNLAGVATSATAALTVNSLTSPSALYNLTGFATAGAGTTGGGVISESDPAYAHVYTPLDFANAIIAANKTAGAVKVIEIMNDLDLGWIEVGSAVQTLGSTPFRSHNAPLLHPRLLATGVSLIDVKPKGGLTIFSASGATLRHATLNIKSTANIIVRNLKFDEMWEWDESSKGDYDKNDWDFITLSNGGGVSNVWIDHCTFTKGYDGVVDMKAGTQNVTLSWCSYVGDDGATNPNSFVRQQLAALEANKSSYAFYNFLRTHGFSVEDIVTIIQGHDKGHLMGSNSLDAANATLSATFHHQWFKNLWDRCVPRLRAGNVHNYNIYVDDTQALAARRLRDGRAALLSTADRNTLNNTYSFNPPLNGSISTEGAALLVEKSVYRNCLWPLRNNQTDVTNPVYTGKIVALDSIYHFDNADGSFVDVRGNSTDAGNPMGPFQAPIIAFGWNGFSTLPYTYTTDDPATLQSLVTAGAGAGKITWSKENWLKTTY